MRELTLEIGWADKDRGLSALLGPELGAYLDECRELDTVLIQVLPFTLASRRIVLRGVRAPTYTQMRWSELQCATIEPVAAAGLPVSGAEVPVPEIPEAEDLPSLGAVRGPVRLRRVRRVAAVRVGAARPPRPRDGGVVPHEARGAHATGVQARADPSARDRRRVLPLEERDQHRQRAIPSRRRSILRPTTTMTTTT